MQNTAAIIEGCYGGAVLSNLRVTSLENTLFWRYFLHGLIKQLQTFEFIFNLSTMEPILQMILIVNNSLQSSNLDLLTAVQQIISLEKSLNSMRKC